MGDTKKVKHGFVLGKFMPLHKGHQHLLRFAQECSEHLTIMVCSLPDDPIPGEIRFGWVRQLFPDAHVVHQDTPIPQEPADDVLFWEKWKAAIAFHVPEQIDVVFASEAYGWRLAAEVGARFIPVDYARAMMPISGTAVRNNPLGAWKYLPEPVRAYYTKRVVIVGPESAGKSTLVKKLATHFQTVGVEEYARPLFDALVQEGLRKPGEFLYEDLSDVARGQMALEQSLLHEANQFIVCDTDALTTLTWSDHLYGKHEQWLEDVAFTTDYDLTLVLDPIDVQYVQDGQRIMKELQERKSFTKRLIGNLRKANRDFEVVTGDYNARFNHAVRSIEKLLGIKTTVFPVRECA